MSQTDIAAIEAATMRRVFWRIMPFLFIGYLIAYIDRANVGFASLQMNKDVGIDAKAFGLGAGIFFLGYFILEVPSNLGLQRFGARRWMGRIMISWGIVSACFAFIVGPQSFLWLRFLLGAAEAGFFPGVILYLTFWFPAVYRARIVGIFMVALPVAVIFGSPVSAALLGLDGALGLRGWQWLFILEGLPAILLGVMSFFWLTDKPDHAAWLKPEQRDWLVGRLERERTLANRVPHLSVWQVLRNKHVLVMGLVYAGAAGASAALAVWQPQVLKSFGLTNMQTGFVNTIPYATAAVLMVWWGRRSDRTGERVWHNAIPFSWMVIGFTGVMFTTGSLWLTVLMLTFVLVGTYASKGPFWALSSEWLGPTVSAAGLAQINALGNLAGFFCNYMIGAIKEATGSFAMALMPILVLSVIAAIAVLIIGRAQPHVVPAE